MKYESPYGGRNDRALWLVQEAHLDEGLWMRAHKDTGEITISLNCNDVFAWACADCEELPEDKWLEFEKSLDAARDHFDTWSPPWFVDAWAVKLRGVAPQKPATDRYPEFVKMLDWLEVPWREMKRYDQMSKTTPEQP